MAPTARWARTRYSSGGCATSPLRAAAAARWRGPTMPPPRAAPSSPVLICGGAMGSMAPGMAVLAGLLGTAGGGGAAGVASGAAAPEGGSGMGGGALRPAWDTPAMALAGSGISWRAPLRSITTERALISTSFRLDDAPPAWPAGRPRQKAAAAWAAAHCDRLGTPPRWHSPAAESPGAHHCVRSPPSAP